MIEINEILKQANVHPSRVKGCYVFGSQVYGTSSEGSDWDIILVANAASPEVEHKGEKYNVHVIVPDVFKKLVEDNHIKAIECLFAPDWAKSTNFAIEFKSKPSSFRHNISHTVSNSWVKCKKKLEQGDYYIGIKSLFHSLRIADFGIQFAKSGKIDFQRDLELWKEISSRTWTWPEIQEKWQPLRNSRMTEFRSLTEK